MALIDDWKTQFPRLWSVRLALVAAAFSAFETGFTYYINGKPPVLAAIATVVAVGAAVARVVAQPGLEK